MKEVIVMNIQLVCCICKKEEFEVNQVYSKRWNHSLYTGTYHYDRVQIGEEREQEGIYAHKCKNCGHIDLFDRDVTKK